MSVFVPMSPLVAPRPVLDDSPAAKELDEAFFLKEVDRLLAEARREAKGDDGSPPLPGSTTQW
jgi:hypothetical protein